MKHVYHLKDGKEHGELQQLLIPYPPSVLIILIELIMTQNWLIQWFT